MEHDPYRKEDSNYVNPSSYETTDSQEVWNLVNEALDAFAKEDKAPGLAIDLGCGNSPSTIELLRRGWKVIALDYNIQALEDLKLRINQLGENWIEEGKIQFVCQKIEDYQFPETVDLIIARDALPYCHPKKIKIVWDQAYYSLVKGGRIVGNLFLKQYRENGDRAP